MQRIEITFKKSMTHTVGLCTAQNGLNLIHFFRQRCATIRTQRTVTSPSWRKQPLLRLGSVTLRQAGYVTRRTCRRGREAWETFSLTLLTRALMFSKQVSYYCFQTLVPWYPDDWTLF